MAIVGMVIGYARMGRGPGGMELGLAVIWIWHDEGTLRIIANSWPRRADHQYALYFDRGTLVEHQRSGDGWLIQDIHVANLNEEFEINLSNAVAPRRAGVGSP
jgi:hypothetical protein